MKSMVKTALTLSLLLPLAGCWDCCSAKKSDANGEVATHGHIGEKASKCSHKGCTHDHSKDANNQVAVTETTTETVVDNDNMDMDDQVENEIVMDDNMNDENMDEMN